MGPSSSRLVLSPWALFAGFSVCCTTTLDPTTLDQPDAQPGGANSGGQANIGCPDASETGGAGFVSCVNLSPCLSVGGAEEYILCQHNLSYDAAAFECGLRGGHLVEIDSAEENLLLAQSAEESIGTNIWLGGRRSEAYVWAWQDSQTVFWQGGRDGTPVEGVFVAWEPGEPNNTSTVSDEPEKCLALTLGDTDWNDRACSIELAFACERD